MDVALIVAVGLALAFAVTNGLHDASNAIATLVATRAARPRQALALAALFNLLGPLLVGGAVASAIGGIVTIGGSEAVERHRRRPARRRRRGTSSPGAGACRRARGTRSSAGSSAPRSLAGGADAVRWGGLDGIHPVGVFGACIALAVSPPLGALAGLLLVRALRRGARAASRRWRDLAQGGQWVTSATLAFSHGANDAQKSAGVIAARPARRRPHRRAVGAAVGDGRLRRGADARHRGGRLEHRAHGRAGGIYHLHPVDGLCSQGASAAVILGASLVGAPDVDDAGRRLVGRRRRRRPAALAPRTLGGRAPDGNGMAADDARERRDRGARAARRAGAGVSRDHWFLPDMPDVLGLLRAQVALTVRGMDAFAAWAAAGGDPELAATVRAIEHEADAAKGALRDALRDAFVTPLDPEDVFALSRGDRLDPQPRQGRDRRVGGHALPARRGDGDDGRAARAVGAPARRRRRAARRRAAATPATPADAAVKAERHLEKAYRAAMGALAEVDDLRVVMGRQELYRRCSRMGEAVGRRRRAAHLRRAEGELTGRRRGARGRAC